MSDDKLNRRQFFQRAAVLGAVAVGAGGFLAGCKKGGGGGSESAGGGGGGESAGGGAKAQKAGGDLSCNDTSGLEPQQIKVRESLKYVDKTEKPDQHCANCQLFKAPAKEGTCGGCQTVPGPINPNGWCTAWVAKS